MSVERLLIVDLTGESARFRVLEPGSGSMNELARWEAPWRFVIRNKDGGLIALTGDESEGIQDDDRTLVFDSLHKSLSRIDDVELQSHVIGEFWNSLRQKLSRLGLFQDGKQTLAYVIPPSVYPPALLERFGAACGGDFELRLAGFAHEAFSLVVGFLRSDAFQSFSHEEVSGRKTFCLIVVNNELDLDVVCFDHDLVPPNRHQVLIRDHFHTTCSGLSSGLMSCDWLGAFSTLVTVESAGLTLNARQLLDITLNAISVDILHKRHELPESPCLRTEGAANIAMSALGGNESGDEITAAAAYQIGVRLNQQQFYPLLRKGESVNSSHFPMAFSHLFKLRGRPGSEMQLGLYCGYSDRIDGATLLGRVTLSQAELAKLAQQDTSVIMAVVRLDKPGSGEFSLGVLPEDRIVTSMPFTLPGMFI